MPIQITINPHLIHYENKTNTVKSLHHVKRSLFFLIRSFHSYIIKYVNYNLYKSINYAVKHNCKDFVQILWILFTILTGVVHSGLAGIPYIDTTWPR